MADGKDRKLVHEIIRRYVERLREQNVDIWRLYLYGSYASKTHREDSDIDLAVFLDKDDIDSFDEDLMLMKLRWDIDLRIEPHSFARTDFDETNPLIREIVERGERII